MAFRKLLKEKYLNIKAIAKELLSQIYLAKKLQENESSSNDLSESEKKTILKKLNIDDSPEPEIENINVQGLQEFFEDFIGVIMVGFNSYNQSILNLNNLIQAKMITSVRFEKNSFWIELTNLSNLPGGFIKITPTKAGQFMELEANSAPTIDSMYRILFLGGDAFEYLDTEKGGSITFHKTFKGEISE